MMEKRSTYFDFFLGHLYDEVGQMYDIDGDRTRALVKYVKQFQDGDDKNVLRHLKNNGSKDSVVKILSELAAREGVTEMREDSLSNHFPFAMPEGMPLRQTQHINYLELNKRGKMKTAGPAFTVPVSDNEKATAKKVRKSFEEVLKAQNKFMKFLSILFDHLEELEDQTGLVKISPLLKQYEHKMKRKFNSYIREFSKALGVYENNFSDTEMDDIRDLIIENIRSMREAVIDLVVLMKDVGDENFVQEAVEKYKTLQDLGEKLEGIIRDEWFGHIDYDILGKIRLGHEIPLSIKKRG